LKWNRRTGCYKGKQNKKQKTEYDRGICGTEHVIKEEYVGGGTEQNIMKDKVEHSKS
jgi:hypothetical protein